MATRSTNPFRHLKSNLFSELYFQLLTTDNLSAPDRQKVLTLSVLFLRQKEVELQRLGYRMLVLYSLKCHDLRPLFDVSIELGLAPVANAMERLIGSKETRDAGRSVILELSSAYLESFHHNNVYLTSDQLDLLAFCDQHTDQSVAIAAPTSYGKTGLVLDLLGRVEANVCIVVPTKALLAQTKKRILDAAIRRIDKITTHPEMYSPSDTVVTAVLTQERLLRLLQRNPELGFDYVVIDEAHNLLGADDRGILLAASILILLKRNPRVALKFLTPFLRNPENLQVRHGSYAVNGFSINEYVKTERLYIADLTNERKVELYDQFLDRFLPAVALAPTLSATDFIEEHSAKKNIIYFNQPKKLETFAASLCENLEAKASAQLDTAARELGKYVHADYALVDYLRRGVVYHHGSVPDNVRLYVETLFSELPELRHLVTTSTLLEGVNLPAERMFILEIRKGPRHLTANQMRNLVGRLCRFHDIFNPKTPAIDGLSPEVYVLKSRYMDARANLRGFIRKTMAVAKEVEDELGNVMLAQTKIADNQRPLVERAEDYVENLEKGTIPNYSRKSVTTAIGRACFNNNLREIAILENENQMDMLLRAQFSKAFRITTATEVFEVLDLLFLPFLRDSDTEPNLLRFRHQATRRYYSMLLDWRAEGRSYKEMIARTVKYWNGLEADDSIVFVGKWGDLTRSGHRQLWTDIRGHSEKSKVNLAIVRLKDEMDFLDNVLMRFVETMHDLSLIEGNFYSRLKYGTSDDRKISLIKAGLSLSLSNLLLDERYARFTRVDLAAHKVQILPGVLDEMKRNGESAILVTEARHNMRVTTPAS